MKEWLKNLLSTTALTLIAISIYAWVTGDTSVHLLSIFPSIMANIVIHIGLLIIRWFDIKTYVIELAYEATFVIGVVIAVGCLVGWFDSFAIWLTISIALAVFAIACLINARQMKRDVAEINESIVRLKQVQLAN